MARPRHVIFALALAIGAAGVASAQTLNLDQEQRLKVYRTLIKEAVAAPPPASASIVVGSDLPATVETYAMPVYVVDSTPPAGGYRFTVWNNQVVLVERNSRKVVAIIRE